MIIKHIYHYDRLSMYKRVNNMASGVFNNYFNIAYIYISKISRNATQKLLNKTLVARQKDKEHSDAVALIIHGILPKGPYPPCLRMAGRTLWQDTLELDIHH